MSAGESPRILLVEDDAAVRAGLDSRLKTAGYAVTAVGDGDSISARVRAYRPDVTIVDINLPGPADGFLVAAAIRAETDAPIVFLTAADAVQDRLRAFEVGADDYVTKPFSTAELLARLRVLLRRSGRLRSPTLQVRDLVLDRAARTAARAGNDLGLTDREFAVLWALVRDAGTVHSKVRLLAEVWGFDGYDPNVVEVCVSALRRKLEQHGPRMIHTERGRGYVVRL